MSNVTALPDSLADLDTEASGRILDVARPVTLDAGQFVFHLGDTCEAFVILVEGQIRVQLTSASGREVTLYRIEPGGSCLLTTSCLFSHEHYPAEAVTETQIRALTIPKPEFEQLLRLSGLRATPDRRD